jgi:hypothetical protein
MIGACLLLFGTGVAAGFGVMLDEVRLRAHAWPLDEPEP